MKIPLGRNLHPARALHAAALTLGCVSLPSAGLAERINAFQNPWEAVGDEVDQAARFGADTVAEVGSCKQKI